MPRGDGTGPMGSGATTGKGAGFCVGFGTPGFANPRVRGGRARGGRRAGFRHMYYATGVPGWAYSMPQAPAYQPPEQDRDSEAFNPEYEKEILKNQAEYLKQHLEEVNKRIQELEDEKDEKNE